MKIKDITLSAAAIGERVVKAIAIGAVEVWSAVKYIVFKDPVVEQICATNWGDGVGITEEDAAKVTDIGALFSTNADITSFDELGLFTGVKSIASKGFFNCSNLKSIDLTNIENLEENAFNGCANMTIDLKMPNLKGFGKYTFGGYFKGSGIVKVSDLGSIEFIKSYTATNGGCFENCVNLTEVVLPETCKKIGGNSSQGNTFAGCTSLRSINIENVDFIAGRSFQNCTSLNIDVVNHNITELAELVFYNSGIKSIDCPNVKTIGASALRKVNIRELSFPNLETISYSLPIESDVLEVLNLGKITSLPGVAGYGTIYSKSLKKLELPSTITEIGVWALLNCTALETLIVYASAPPTLGSSALPSVISKGSIYVPDQSVTAYREASGWISYADQIKPLSQYVEPTNE